LVKGISIGCNEEKSPCPMEHNSKLIKIHLKYKKKISKTRCSILLKLGEKHTSLEGIQHCSIS
jgi:hypothetical protein